MRERSKTDPGTRRAVEQQLLNVLRENDLTLGLIEGMVGDRQLSDRDRAVLHQLRQVRGQAFYADLLFALSYERYPSELAEALWQGIVHHRTDMLRALGRNPGVSVVALDYLKNIRGVLGTSTFMRHGKLEQVAEVALLDGLTSLWMHSTFMERLEAEVRRGSRYHEVFSVLLLDLDDFKVVNDRHGHQVGDSVLEQVAAVLRQVARDTDSVGRYGGEEFGLVLPRTGGEAATAVAERIRTEVQAAFAASTRTTVSAGLASFPQHGSTRDALLRAADEALYAAKARGKNAVVVAGEANRGETATLGNGARASPNALEPPTSPRDSALSRTGSTPGA